MNRFALAAALSAALIIANTLPAAPHYVLLTARAAADGSTLPGDGTPPAAGSAFAPMGYFEAKCARCHGPNGSFYGETFGKNLNEAQLHEVVRAMAAGPAGAPLEGRDLEVEVAYHRAMIARTPFLVVVEVTGGGSQAWTLKGEATPGSTVSLRAGETNVLAALDGSAWTATLPATVTAAQMEITATKGDDATVLKLADTAWSHAQAAAAPVAPQ